MTPGGLPFLFIVGCGRSGTTLLRAMCDAHPGLAVPPESHFIVPPPTRFDVASFVDRLVADDRFALWDIDRASLIAALVPAPVDYPDAVRRVFAEWATRRGKARYADKTPGYVLHIAALSTLFPEAVFVHLVRDGRDVACSFLELGWAKTVEEAALHWQLRVQRGRRSGRALTAARYHELRYEELVRDPEQSLRQVCTAIDLTFDASMLDHADNAARVIGTTNHPDYHRRLALPVTSNLRDWRRELSDEDVMRFELLAGDTLADLGYEPAAMRPSTRLRAEVGARWIRWQLHRARRRVSG